MSILRSRLRPVMALIFFLITVTVFTAFTHIGAPLFTREVGIPIGIGFIAVAIPFHIFGAKLRLLYIFSILSSAVGMGFMASSYYCVKGVPSEITDLAPATLLPIAIMLIACIVLILLPSIKHPVIVILSVLETGLIIASVVFWCIRGGDFYAFSLFCHVIAVFYTIVLGFTVDEEERSLLRDVSFGGFGAFLIIGLIVIIVLSGGDGCDCGDCGDCGCGGKDKKKR